MFSDKGLPLEAETVEYAWMVEVGVGDLTGRLTAPQVNKTKEERGGKEREWGVGEMRGIRKLK